MILSVNFQFLHFTISMDSVIYRLGKAVNFRCVYAAKDEKPQHLQLYENQSKAKIQKKSKR